MLEKDTLGWQVGGDGHHACGHEFQGLVGNVVPELGIVVPGDDADARIVEQLWDFKVVESCRTI